MEAASTKRICFLLSFMPGTGSRPYRRCLRSASAERWLRSKDVALFASQPIWAGTYACACWAYAGYPARLLYPTSSSGVAGASGVSIPKLII